MGRGSWRLSPGPSAVSSLRPCTDVSSDGDDLRRRVLPRSCNAAFGFTANWDLPGVDPAPDPDEAGRSATSTTTREARAGDADGAYTRALRRHGTRYLRVPQPPPPPPPFGLVSWLRFILRRWALA